MNHHCQQVSKSRRSAIGSAPTAWKQIAKALTGFSLAGALLLLLAAAPINCQVSDGDDQFQAYHEDIGRISGQSSAAAQSNVAPASLIRQPQPEVAQTLALPAPVNLPDFQPRVRAQAQPAAPRKPNRITLAVRPHAPISSSLVQDEQPGSGVVGQQFAAAPALIQPVPAHHSALMAQVAAERQSALASPDYSLGSPIEALSSPAVAQVQPPPTLRQEHLRQHQHQHLALQAEAQPSTQQFSLDQPQEPLIAPSFEQVLGSGCPHLGVFSYPNKDHCDRYYMCTNGTFTEEACPNGLGYSQMGAVYQHCAYNWNVNCGSKKAPGPISSPGCPWQFGIFPTSASGRCSIDYHVCEWGVPETKRCSPEGLFYDDRIKGCQWADQLGCKSEALLNFKCPPEDEDNPYWPYPRYYHSQRDVIVCVSEQPRLVHCTEDQAVDPASLACIELRKGKKVKKF